MKTFSKIFLSMAVIFGLSFSVVIAGEKPWFDMDNCDMCKSINKYDGLKENMTWEQHSINNGIMTVSTVKPSHLKAYRKAQMDMDMVAKKLESGQKVNSCRMCSDLGSIFEKGVNSEKVNTRHGSIWLLTSDNSESISRLQSWSEKTRHEMEKMMAHNMQEKH
ncbi:MAG: hypothetical protein V3V99_11575 [candidate division Zixibacteria bacterium]